MVKVGVSLRRGRQRDLYSLDEVAGRVMEAKSTIFVYKRDKELRGTMAEQDTIKLLCECGMGTQMDVTSLDEVLGYVSNKEFKQCLLNYREDHQKVRGEIRSLLTEHHHEGKTSGPMAKSMLRLKTNMKLVPGESDETVADLMTDGCNIGIESLNKYLNQCKAADERSRAMAIHLIGLEEGLVRDMRMFLQRDAGHMSGNTCSVSYMVHSRKLNREDRPRRLREYTIFKQRKRRLSAEYCISNHRERERILAFNRFWEEKLIPGVKEQINEYCERPMGSM